MSDVVQGIKNSNENYYPAAPYTLHGRRQIFTNESEITPANVRDVLNKALPIHLQNRGEMVYLEKYLRGIQPVLNRQKVYHKEINNRVVVNMANQIVAFKTAEFAGEPIQYISRGAKKSVPKKVEKLNSMMLSEEKSTKDMELAGKMFTYGVGHRLILNDKADKELFDEAPFEIYIPDTRNTFVIRRNDVSKRVLAGVTYVYLDEPRVLYTVYTEKYTFTIGGTAQKAEILMKPVTHNFGLVPLVEYPCNNLYMGAFEVVHDMLNALSAALCDRLDGIDQFIQAIMVFEGVDITLEQLTELKEAGAIKLPPTMDGRQSRVYYLNQQLDQSQTQTLVDDIKQTILEIVGMPSQGNANTSDSSNNGAIIMKNGWWNAEARKLETIGMWNKAETESLKIFLKICEDANALTGLAVSDVQPKYGTTSYEDLLVKTQSFSTLRTAGVTPLQAFKYSHLGQDPESDAMAFEEYQEKRAQELDMASGIYGGGDMDAGVDAEDEDGDGQESSVGESGANATCPVCKRRFRKKNGNQIYDRDVCRRIAQKQKRGGYAR